jgi:hypothetical protein
MKISIDNEKFYRFPREKAKNVGHELALSGSFDTELCGLQ